MTSHGDYLQFEGGVIGARHRFGWSGPWPPPERLGIAVGRQSQLVSVYDPEEVEPDVLAAIEEHADTTMYERMSHSELPEQDEDSRVARGALYQPTTTEAASAAGSEAA